jgi:Uma2 family endonuclease
METGTWPRTRRWTREEYHRAAESGIFRPEERLELLEGEILEKMSPQSSPHASGILLSAEALRDAFGRGFHVREEKPIVLSDLSEPEPDIAVVRGTSRDTPKHPTPANTALVMEVSASTLAFDQGEKAAAYACSGIADYWILNLRQRHLEVRRDPGLMTDNRYGYRTLLIFTPGMEASPLAAPEAKIAVDDLLPMISAEEEDADL